MSVKAEKTREKNTGHGTQTFFEGWIQWSIFKEYCERCRTYKQIIFKTHPTTKEMVLLTHTHLYGKIFNRFIDQIVETFEKLSASDQTRNMSDTSSDGWSRWLIISMIIMIISDYC